MKEYSAIFPYTIDETLIFSHKELVDFELIMAISPKGNGMNKKDIYFPYNGPQYGIDVTESLFDFPENISTIFLSKSINNIYKNDNEITNLVKSLLQHRKNIICCKKLYNTLMDNLEFDHTMSIKNISKPMFQINDFLKINCFKNQLYDNDIPIIAILAETENNFKYEALLHLYKRLLKNNYKVSCISYRKYNDMFGVYNIPNIIFDSQISYSTKIIKFNHYVKWIELNDKPDIIIVDIPGGIMKLNNYVFNDFGYLPYIISNAISIDLACFCTTYADYLTEYYDRMFEFIYWRFGINVKAYFISPNMINWIDTYSSNKICFHTINYNVINTYIQNNNFNNVFNVLNNQHMDVAYKTLMEEFQ